MPAKKIVLKNGLRLILVPHQGLAATVLVLVEAGSEYETKQQNGISHFLEHLMFKGTVRRPKPGMISAELDSLGAEYNAFTGQEYTGYWAKAQAHKLPQIVDLVTDLYLNPLFIPEEIEKERGVVIEEINMYEDTPMRRVQELFTGLVYGDQPAGWDIAGKKEVIRQLTRDDFVRYRTKHYVPAATAVIVSGNFKEAPTTKMLLKIFGGLRRAARVRKPATHESQKSPAALVKFKESDQSHLVLGVRAFDIFDKRRYALQVLADVLGGGMSSRLFHRVREELGAAYYVRATPELFLDHGHLEISAGVDHQKIEIVSRAILEELRRFSSDLVPEVELKKAKDHMIGNILIGLETSDQLASFYGGQEILTHSFIEPKALIDRLSRVTAEDIRRAARSLFTNARLNMAVIGPYKNQAPFKKLLRF